jgi:uncharacterized protein (DUF3820 family)
MGLKKCKANKQNNMTLTFGKFKGQELDSTPQWYQNWLSKQDWFKPKKTNPFIEAQKNISELSDNLKGWNGYSRNGAATYDRLFESEMAMENLLYCDCGNRKDVNEKNCGCGGIYSL